MIFHQVVICDCWPTSVKVCFVNTIERVPASPKGDFEARGRRLKTLPKQKKCQQKYFSGKFEQRRLLQNDDEEDDAFAAEQVGSGFEAVDMMMQQPPPQAYEPGQLL